MAKVPLNWLLKIGDAVLKPAAKTLSEAVNILHDSTVSLGSRTTTLEQNKVNKTDLLTLEEISAATSLTNKGAAAASVKNLNDTLTANNGTKFKFWYNTSTGEYGFKVGADTFVPFSNVRKLLTALQYSGLDIDETSTFDEICTALADVFPEYKLDATSNWRYDTVLYQSSLKRGTKYITFSGTFGDVYTTWCETLDIPVDRYKRMTLEGVIEISDSSINSDCAVEFISNGKTLQKIVLPESTKKSYSFTVDSSEHLRINVTGGYQSFTVKVCVSLCN